jgi:hypothetical protein
LRKECVETARTSLDRGIVAVRLVADRLGVVIVTARVVMPWASWLRSMYAVKREDLLQTMYAAFNARDIDAVLLHMTVDRPSREAQTDPHR